VGIQSLKKHIGLAEREIPVLAYGYFAFSKPSVHGFPTESDPADRNCRYLVQPPTVPSMARLQSYQRPPRGGRGSADGPTSAPPSGAAAAAPPAGAELIIVFSDGRMCFSYCQRCIDG
jgi:hypothetical protein